MEYSYLFILLGLLTLVGHLAGAETKRFHLPSILGYMLLGILVGPYLFALLSEAVLEHTQFLTKLTLGFVALSIGLELRRTALRKIGSSIVPIIFCEAFVCFFVVFAGLYLLTGDLPMSIVFAALAPASAPAGTVAVIHELKAKGTLTTALYAVVGFDDGLAVLIFAFASSFAGSLLAQEVSNGAVPWLQTLGKPIFEIFVSLAIGLILGWLFCRFLTAVKEEESGFTVMLGFTLLASGLAPYAHGSLILINLVMGIMLGNKLSSYVLQRLHKQLSNLLPWLFILFFCLAGAHLDLFALPKLGWIGAIYILSRSFGLVSGAWLGGLIGRAEEKIRRYVGMGILSHAGVAIGLALITQQNFAQIGSKHSMAIGASVLTTVTATSVFFEIIGPLLTRFALVRAGEAKLD